MKDLIKNLKNSDTWKTQLTTAIKFIFSKDTNEDCVMHTKSDSTDFLIYDNLNEVIEELFESIFNRDHTGLETSMRDFIFDCVYLLYFKCHKINPNHGASYIDSPDWKKNKTKTLPWILSMMMINAYNTLQQAH